MIATEGVTLIFTEDAIAEVANIASKVNEDVENIGARRLHTILEKVLEEISFTASEKKKADIKIDDKYVKSQIGDIYKDSDLTNLFFSFLSKQIMLRFLLFLVKLYQTKDIFR